MSRDSLQPYIWDSEQECLPRERLREVQERRFAWTLDRVQNSQFYRKKLAFSGLEHRDIGSISDLTKVPFTTKDELRENYPYGMLSIPREEIVRIHASSGTTGRPTLVAYSRRDLDTWSELMARVLATVGVRPGVTLYNSYAYGLFTGGLGFQYGAERIGATVVPVSGANAGKQLALMRDLEAQVLLCTPSFSITLFNEAERQGMALEDLSISVGVFGGEFWSHSLRKKIEDAWRLRAYDTYGLSEVIGPGVAQECSFGGLHLYEDHFFPEIVSVETGEPLPDGEHGELVLSSLSKEAMPILRYRTRDRTRLIDEPCPCGRTFRRIERVVGRIDDKIQVNGKIYFPAQIEEALLSVDGFGPNYQIQLDENNDGKSETLHVCVEVAEGVERQNRAQLLNRQANEALLRIGLSASLELLEAGTLPPSEGKAKRVIFLRR